MRSAASSASLLIGQQPKFSPPKISRPVGDHVRNRLLALLLPGFVEVGPAKADESASSPLPWSQTMRPRYHPRRPLLPHRGGPLWEHKIDPFSTNIEVTIPSRRRGDDRGIQCS